MNKLGVMPTEVIVHPFGEIKRSLLEAICAAVREQFNVGATLGQKLPVPTQAYSVGRKQYRSTEFLRQLETLPHDDGRAKLGVTDVDLFVPELNFVFGEASASKLSAVFSVARLDP